MANDEAKKPGKLGSGIEVDADGQITKIDILQMEVNQKLPYWLSPIERFKDRHDAILEKNRQRWLREQGYITDEKEPKK